MSGAKGVIYYLGDFQDFSTFDSVHIKFVKISACKITYISIFAKITAQENKCFYSISHAKLEGFSF